MLITISEWFNGNRINQQPGKGLFSPLHIFLILIFFTLTLINFLLSKKNNKYGSIVVTICCILMPIFRLIRMTMEILYGISTPTEALPFHLCHVMAFVIPIVYFLKFNKALPCVMFYGMLGGVMTFLFGNYYQYNILNFYDIESIILHVMLALTATSSYAKGDFKFELKNIHYLPLFLIVLTGWASIGNFLFNKNYMYIKENGLPFKLLPGHFLFTYLLIAFIVFFLMYLPFIVKYYKTKLTNKKDKVQ